MPRAAKGAARTKARKRILRAARGYWGTRSRHKQQAKITLTRAGAYAWRDRRQRRRNMRRLWITRINAACRLNDITYSAFINALNVKGIELNRKVLADLALQDPQSFTDLVNSVKN